MGRVKLIVATLVVAFIYTLSLAFASDKARLVPSEKSEGRVIEIDGVEYPVVDPGNGKVPDPKIIEKKRFSKDDNDNKEKLKSSRPLGAFLHRGWIWTGTGSLHSKKWDGPWRSFEGGVNVTDRHQIYAGYSDWKGEGPGLNKYRGTGDERRIGWQFVNVTAQEQDEVRLAYVLGQEEGRSAFYEQETEFRALDLRLARTWFMHERTFFPGGTIEFFWRKQLSIDKESSFKGSPLTRAQDPIDGPEVRRVQAAPDLAHRMFLKGKLRLSLAAVYERQWWKDQSPIERDLLGVRVRLTHRGSGQTSLDLMPYRVANSKGIMFGFSWSF